MFTRLTDVINSPCHHIFMLITSKMALTTLVVALSTFLAVASVSVNPEENTNLYEPLNPNMLQCPNTTIEGKDGDTVILPCSTKNKTDISHDEVEWSIKDPATGKKFVHLYFQGEDFLHNQRDDFKDRTSLFKEELSSGNCSLSLRVTTSHSGRYYCCVGGRLHCTVNLKVLSKGTNDTSLKHQDDPESPDKPNIHSEENNHLYDPLNPNMLQCPSTTIEGKVGDRVILPCSTKNKMDISLEEVEWTFMDPITGKEIVHLYFQGEGFLHEQSDKFKDRTSLFKEKLSSGNCSLSLLVNTSHSGRYYCCVGGRLYCTVNLKVLKAEEDDTSQKHQNVTVSPDKPNNVTDGPNNIIGVVLGVGIPVIIIIIMALVYCYREHLKNFCCGRNANNPPDNVELEDLAQQPPQNQENEPVDQNQNEERIQMIGYEDQDDPADGNEVAAGN